jgi:hypothetical protein
MKGFKVAFAAILSFLLVWGLCACGSPDPYKRTVKITTPLSQPIYGDASVAPFSVANPLNNLKKMDVFIFKGRIEKIEEIDINYNIGTVNDIHMVDQWLSISYVKIENILFGEIPGISDTIKVVSGQSTRSLISEEIRLLEGQEYYFITYVFNKKEPIDIENDPIRIVEFGDTMAGRIYELFPINDGVVSFQGWTFTGAKSTAYGRGSITGGIYTIDEESFLKQFMAMIQDAKSKLELETDAPEASASIVD